MELTKIELVSEETIKKIKDLNLKAESTEIDFKEIFKVSDKKSKVEFIKDIKSFANSKGGYIIFGVNNNSEWIGLDDRSDDDVDDATIYNIIDEYVDGEINIISNIVDIDNKSFFIIYINKVPTFLFSNLFNLGSIWHDDFLRLHLESPWFCNTDKAFFC